MNGLQKQMDLGPVGPFRRDHSSARFIAASLSESPAGEARLMESICERENMCKALKRVLMKELVNAGYVHCVSIDISKSFDRVNHDRLMSILARRIRDKRVLRLIRAFLNAGVMRDGVVIETN